MLKLTTTSPEVLAFVATIQKRSDERMKRDFPSLELPKFVCERGTKFIAIDVINQPSQNCGRSVFCFLAAEDTESKGLGKVLRGDVLKPGGYKAPAKHSRGNLFSATKGEESLSPSGYGVKYLGC